MLIANAAAHAGVNPQTLRYYERRGLLRPAGRRQSGYREYSEEDVRVVRFVKRAQDLGFSLDDVAELLKLRRATAGRREAARGIAERHRVDLEGRIRDMQRMHAALGQLIATCHNGRDLQCPILEAFEVEKEASHGRS
jgi:DNA-binding transcriptional MerR regulator